MIFSKLHSVLNSVKNPKNNNTLVKRPEFIETHCWRTIHVESVRSGQPKAYADHRYESIITFEGGHVSTDPNYDMTFAVRQTKEQVAELAKTLVHGWAPEGEGDWYSSRLKVCEMISEGETFQAWRVVVTTPYTD